MKIKYIMLVDPDGEEIGWYIDSQGNVIGKDEEDDDEEYETEDDESEGEDRKSVV